MTIELQTLPVEILYTIYEYLIPTPANLNSYPLFCRTKQALKVTCMFFKCFLNYPDIERLTPPFFQQMECTRANLMALKFQLSQSFTFPVSVPKERFLLDSTLRFDSTSRYFETHLSKTFCKLQNGDFKYTFRRGVDCYLQIHHVKNRTYRVLELNVGKIESLAFIGTNYLAVSAGGNVHLVHKTTGKILHTLYLFFQAGPLANSIDQSELAVFDQGKIKLLSFKNHPSHKRFFNALLKVDLFKKIYYRIQLIWRAVQRAFLCTKHTKRVARMSAILAGLITFSGFLILSTPLFVIGTVLLGIAKAVAIIAAFIFGIYVSVMTIAFIALKIEKAVRHFKKLSRVYQHPFQNPTLLPA